MATERPTGLEDRHFTRHELDRMIELGLFANDDRRLELIHGRLVVVPPEGPEHAATSTSLRDRLIAAYAGQAHVRDAKPLACALEEQPEPDLAVVRGTPSDYHRHHPRGDETLLVVEVSRTTLARDREKIAIYAAAGVPVYWLLDLSSRRLELHRDPRGDRYALVQLLAETDAVDLPDTQVTLRLGELLR
jgi:Uma2 family endonuclease